MHKHSGHLICKTTFREILLVNKQAHAASIHHSRQQSATTRRHHADHTPMHHAAHALTPVTTTTSCPTHTIQWPHCKQRHNLVLPHLHRGHPPADSRCGQSLKKTTTLKSLYHRFISGQNKHSGKSIYHRITSGQTVASRYITGPHQEKKKHSGKSIYHRITSGQNKAVSRYITKSHQDKQTQLKSV